MHEDFGGCVRDVPTVNVNSWRPGGIQRRKAGLEGGIHRRTHYGDRHRSARTKGVHGKNPMSREKLICVRKMCVGKKNDREDEASTEE